MALRNIAFAIYDIVTFRISKVLEPLLDEIEYRLAKYRIEKAKALPQPANLDPLIAAQDSLAQTSNVPMVAR